MNAADGSTVDFTQSPRPRVLVVGRRVMLAIEQTLAYLTPDEAADLQTQLQRSEADARANARRGTP